MNALASLLNPLNGLIGSPRLFRARADEPRMFVHTISMNNIHELWPNISRCNVHGSITGAGVDSEADRALLPASVEALERYSASIFSEEQFVRASATELGSEAVDLDSLPRCSTAELTHPKCPLVAPDKSAPMRWVQVLSLLTGEVKYMPAVLVYIHAGFATPAEHIVFPITTGCAAHTNLKQAILGGILEVIERDAISILWLQCLALPEIEVNDIPPCLAPYWELYQRSSRDLRYTFLDATTDIGIPVVYGLQTSRHQSYAHTLVACSAALDPDWAVAKVIRDMAAGRVAFRRERKVPDSWDDFTDIFHGAAYMSSAERAHAFDFLRRPGESLLLSQMPSHSVNDPDHDLAMVLERLHRKNLDVFVAEISSDEALRLGLRVVRVIIPGLQPVGFHYRARYLGHPRLYTAPLAMGYQARTEDQLNPWPQPFA